VNGTGNWGVCLVFGVSVLVMSEVVRARLCGWEVSDGAGVGMKLRTGWSSPHRTQRKKCHCDVNVMKNT